MVGSPKIHDARRTEKFAALCLVLASTCVIPARATAEGLIASPEPGWPQWRGPRRDGVCDEKGLLASWPREGPTLLWKTDNLGRGWSSPIVVGERIYITGDKGDDLVVYAFDLDGVIQWQVRNERSWKTPYGGARACCAYSAGRVYNLNAHGRLACLDAASRRAIATPNGGWPSTGRQAGRSAN